MKEQIPDFNEGQLRTLVLLPLFRAMGFQDVDHYHGGPQEQGKDIVMWKPDDLGERVNYGVVVKAGRIRGTATGKGSGAEVAFQIQQCFGDPYIDPVTLEKRYIDVCFVVCPEVIAKEARNSIKSVVEGRGIRRQMRFIHGRKLYGLIDKYLPERTVITELEKIRKTLSSASPDYHVSFRGDKDATHFWLEPKHPSAEPIEFSFNIDIPDTLEGQEMHKSLEKHFKTGTPVTIDKSFITGYDFPDFLKSILDPTGEGFEKLLIMPHPNPRPITFEAIVRGQKGQESEIFPIELRIVQAGTEEITLNNEQQDGPWTFHLVLNKEQKKLTVRLDFKLGGVNVNRALECLNTLQILAGGAIIELKRYDTGFTLVDLPIEEGMFEPVSEWSMALTEKLVYIQSKTRVPLSIPDRDILY